MHPQAALVTRQGFDGGLRLAGVKADALRQISPASTPAAHLHDGSGEHAKQAERQEKVVEREGEQDGAVL
jgi:hypothetical protein